MPELRQVQRILCPIDFSDTSRVALAWAVDLASRYQAPVTLLHVYQAPAFTLPDGVIVGGPELLADTTREVDEAMASWRTEAEEMGAAGARGETLIGSAHPDITRYAVEHAFDLIVIGTHGRTGLQHVLLGSTAEKIVRHAHCPVMTVRSAP